MSGLYACCVSNEVLLRLPVECGGKRLEREEYIYMRIIARPMCLVFSTVATA